MSGDRKDALVVLATVFAASTILAGICGDAGRMCLSFSFVVLAGASVMAMLALGQGEPA